MNLSISDFNLLYKKKIIILLLLSLLLYILANIAGNKYDKFLRKRAEDALLYRGDTKGKLGLMRQLFNGIQPDVIFVGNSITILHINTDFFHKQGIKSFNYATTGYFIG